MIEARQFVDRAQAMGFDFYAGVPCSFLTPFINYVLQDQRMHYLGMANEGDAVAAATGAVLGGKKAVVMMQNSGLGNAINPLSSLNHPFRCPILLIVTHRGSPHITDEPQHELMGAITTPMLELMQIPWCPFPQKEQDIAATLTEASHHMYHHHRPFALVMQKGAVATETLQPTAASPRPKQPEPRIFADTDPLPSRKEVLTRIVERTSPENTVLIATTGYTSRELYAIADRPNHCYMVGSMGCASALGLGLAHALTRKRIIVLDGDGALLMRMGNLASTAAYGRDNLIHLVLDNQIHESTGGQPTLAAQVNFAAAAAACGYRQIADGGNLALIDCLLSRDAATKGASFAHLRIRPGVPGALPRPKESPDILAKRLMHHLNTGWHE